MTPEKFKEIRKAAGMTQAQLAAYLRLSDGRTVRRYESTSGSGSRPVSGPVSRLMEMLEKWQ
jgi:DNA-binding transcriptional regulator YiaG